MKLNWGHFILISFVLFVFLILYMVFRSYQHTNDLVAEDYYAKEIQFQEVIDKKKNAGELAENITWKSTSSGILIHYPALEGKIGGKIVLFRPSDKNLDQEFDIVPDEKNEQVLPSEGLVSGKYQIQIDWKAGEEEYFTEGSVFFSP